MGTITISEELARGDRKLASWGGLRFAIVLGLAAVILPSPVTGAPSQAEIEFFEAKVRPVLVDHCYACHSQQADKVKGGLRLDTREDLLKGGESGPVVVPGDPEQSALIRAVRYTDESLQMPPKNQKLSAAQIGALEQWVRMGAPDPRVAAPSIADKAKTTESASGKSKHWAFQPVKRSAVPAVHQASWVQDPIDAFILAKLEEKGLRPSPQADRRTLIRRVTFDLIGLPPSNEEVNRFVADEESNAFEKVVDRLLTSPQYGECWGRHWLDVARYADTKGYVFEEERRYPYAYTYRDYVIRSLNEDVPYNRFVIEQLAADQLPLGEDKRALAGLGYLTLGRRFLNNPHDIIDDRIDVVTRGLMGLTVACARCHDHKFDPITAQDYYSLYGIFASSSEPEEKPLLGAKGSPEKYTEYVQGQQERLAELNNFRTNKEDEVRSQVRRQTGEYLLAADDVAQAAPDRAEAIARERKLDPGTVQRWVHQLETWKHQPGHPVFAPWFAMSECADGELAAESRGVLGPLVCISREELNPLVAEAMTRSPLQSRREMAERYGALFAEVEAIWQGVSRSEIEPVGDKGGASTPESRPVGLAPAKPTALPDPAFEELRQILYAADSPATIAAGEINRLFDVPSIQKLRALKRKLEEFDATHPGAPPRAMALQDNPVPQNPHVFLRGNPGRPGPEVPRRFIAVLAGGDPKPFQKGSGRLELAEAIANGDNPLTARVLVNRVWLHHFGSGLVRTPSDFGFRSEPPSHPELLDYLAARFVDEGWSLKKLHRWIVLSSTYQQASEGRADLAKLDPANQLLGRMNRRRLDFEATRDSLLAVAGTLDLTAGGHSVDILSTPFTGRRTVYGFVERQNLPGLFRTFDFASPDTTSPQRFSTTVPQQALFMINSPFVMRQTRDWLRRAAAPAEVGVGERVRGLYHMAYQREPSAVEVKAATQFLEAQAGVEPFSPGAPPWQYGYGEYNPALQRVKHFEPLPQFVGDAWQGGPSRPDPILGGMFLKASAGSPGKGHQHAVIRRWTAPRALTVSVSGRIGHESDKGDGVQAWIVSSRSGQLGGWTVKQSKHDIKLAEVEVVANETLDFIVDARESVEGDVFTWSPTIRREKGQIPGATDETAEWDARQDFSGPRELPVPLDAWERYAQVLLMSNEFVFLD